MLILKCDKLYLEINFSFVTSVSRSFPWKCSPCKVHVKTFCLIYNKLIFTTIFFLHLLPLSNAIVEVFIVIFAMHTCFSIHFDMQQPHFLRNLLFCRFFFGKTKFIFVIYTLQPYKTIFFSVLIGPIKLIFWERNIEISDLRLNLSFDMQKPNQQRTFNICT